MPVDINITRVGGSSVKLPRSSNGRFISPKKASAPRFKTTEYGDIYDRKSKRVVATAWTDGKAQELVSILNRKV